MMSFIIRSTPLILLWLALLSGEISTYEIPKEEGPIKIIPLKEGESMDQVYVSPNGEVRPSPLSPANRKWDKEEPKGYVKHKKQGRILGGKTTRINQVPYQIAIELYGTGLWCAGSIYNKLWIISAAHCFVDLPSVTKLRAVENFTVTAGEFDVTQTDRSEQSRKIVQIVAHQFELDTISNDIALFKLDSPLEYNEYVQPIPIMDAKAEYPKGVGIVSGWGYTRLNQPDENLDKDGFTSTLQSTNVYVYTKAECMETYKHYKDYLQIAKNPHALCAGELKGGIGTCHGDSGGPLACYGLKEKYLCGVVSSGLGCGLPQRPGLFTIVSHYADWIKEHAGEGDRPTKSY